MNPNERPRQPQHRLHNDTKPLRNPVSTVLAVVGGTALMVLGFTFSLLILAAAAIIGVAGFGFVWWKTRALRKHLREQMAAYSAQDETVASHADNTPAGDIIEGEILREEREPPR